MYISMLFQLLLCDSKFSKNHMLCMIPVHLRRDFNVQFKAKKIFYLYSKENKCPAKMNEGYQCVKLQNLNYERLILITFIIVLSGDPTLSGQFSKSRRLFPLL